MQSVKSSAFALNKKKAIIETPLKATLIQTQTHSIGDGGDVTTKPLNNSLFLLSLFNYRSDFRTTDRTTVE